MSGEKVQGDHRLNQGETYSVEEYIFRLAVIASRHPEFSSFRNKLERMIFQAEGYLPETLVEFEEQTDGLIYPVFF